MSRFMLLGTDNARTSNSVCAWSNRGPCFPTIRHFQTPQTVTVQTLPLLPVVSTLGMVFGFMIGSSVVIEKVFGWPGVGSYAIDALTASDYAPVQGFVLTMGILFVLLNLMIDLLYVLIDPRVTIAA